MEENIDETKVLGQRFRIWNTKLSFNISASMKQLTPDLSHI